MTRAELTNLMRTIVLVIRETVLAFKASRDLSSDTNSISNLYS